MDNAIVEIVGQEFTKYVDAQMIDLSIAEVGRALEREYKGKNPLFVVVLGGGFMFASDLLKHIPYPVESIFVKVKSYSGTQKTPDTIELGINQDITGREIVIVEDIVDTGGTLSFLYPYIKKGNPKSISVATMLYKRGVYEKTGIKIPVNYSAITIQNNFVVGRGLDYKGVGRNLKDIYIIK